MLERIIQESSTVDLAKCKLAESAVQEGEIVVGEVEDESIQRLWFLAVTYLDKSVEASTKILAPGVGVSDADLKTMEFELLSRIVSSHFWAELRIGLGLTDVHLALRADWKVVKLPDEDYGCPLYGGRGLTIRFIDMGFKTTEAARMPDGSYPV